MRLPWLFASVSGHSMIPALAPGEYVVARRGVPPRPGAVVVVRRPEGLVVKRVTSVGAAGVWVQGDNDYATDDSRTYGAVPAGDVVAEVRWRYYPLRAAGRVR